MTRQALTVFAIIFFLSTSALAQNDAAPNAPVQVFRAQATPANTAARLPLWEAGLFGIGITQPAYPGSAERVGRALGLPYLIYRGKYLRAERGNVGLRALKTPRIEVDVGFAASLGSRSSDIAVRQGMADLGTLIEFGPRLKINLGDIANGRSRSRLQFPLRAVIDIDHGFVSRGIAFEPEWVTDLRLPRRWFVSPSLGAIFGDTKLGDTFYGVAPGEATATRSSYTARSGLIALRAGLLATQKLAPDVRLFCGLRIESLAGAANRDSPLVRRHVDWGAVIGLSWTLARSEQRTED
jgi:outer membrane scaffolding protein for murein synthesis (MipA/OmpV family)